jgi:YidC/Oxa1 family membrane protein insertase
MDRNQIIGLVLIAVIVLTYSIFFAPDPPPPAPKSKSADSIKSDLPVLNPDEAAISEANPSAQSITAAIANEDTVVLENDQVRYIFSTKGGLLRTVRLKELYTFDKKELYLLTPETGDMNLSLKSNTGWLPLRSLYFEPAFSCEVKGDSAFQVLTLRLLDTSGRSLSHTYRLAEKGYTLRHTLQAKGMGGLLSGNQAKLDWSSNLPQMEKDLQACRINSTVNTYTLESELVNLGESKLGLEEDSIVTPAYWVSHKHKFFSCGVIAAKPFSSVAMRSRTDEPDKSNVKYLFSSATFTTEGLETDGLHFTYYFGPNDYKIQEGLAPGFEHNVYLGWTIFGTINRYTIMPLFRFLEQYIVNYGIIIIILLIIVKIILSPLSYRSYVSMAKMRLLKPELDLLKEKYGDDMTGMQAEQMQIYQKAGVNPVSGCVPVLLQMPIFLALFNFFPNAIELRQAGFLWADDLSSYDNILDLPFTIPFYGDHVSLFTLLMTASTLVYTWYNNQMNPTTVTGPMKTISYVMPITFLFFLNSFASGLTLYYFVSNVVTIGQQMIIAKFVDEDKLRKILEDNKKKNVNKPMSRMQQRLQEAMKSKETTKPATKPASKTTAKPESKKTGSIKPETKGKTKPGSDPKGNAGKK